jgi:glycosyltransferase involved in cell wall biosynthesis
LKTPVVSVIVPVYNEEWNLKKLHVALKKQDFKNYEIIYIDNGSEDRSWKILQRFSKESNVRCFKLDKKYSVGYVRAFGVEKAKGKFIASIDADCIPTSNWLNMVRYLDDKTAIVGFPVIPPAELDYLAQRFEYIGDGRPDSKVYLHGSGVIMRREVVLKVGNYPDQTVGEDTLLFKKILEAGYEFKYVKEAKIYHKYKQQTFIAFLKRFYKTGKNNTNMKTFWLFDVIFPFLILTSILLTYFLGMRGLPLILLPIGFLLNPKTVLFYARNFAKPRNIAIRFVIFAVIKIAISFAFVFGVWRATITLFRK